MRNYTRYSHYPYRDPAFRITWEYQQHLAKARRNYNYKRRQLGLLPADEHQIPISKSSYRSIRYDNNH